MSSTQANFFDSNYVFDNDMALNFAVGLTAYDGETENILDPTYGNIGFIRYAWGVTDDGLFYEKTDEIPSHTCTKEELGIESN